MAAEGSDLNGKVCLVSGGTAGIGLVTARKLAERGACVTIVGRVAARGHAALAAIRAQSGNDNVHFVQADLSDHSAIRSLAAAFTDRHQRLDVLVNNAGGMFGKRQESAQGCEMTFALNHLSYFLLTLLLLPVLQAAAPARVVVVASEAHRGVTLDFDDLQAKHRYRGWQAYRRSKLANILFTHELARRLDWQQITVNSLHPGFVATDIGIRHGLLPGFLWWLAKRGAIDVETGALTSVHLAASREVEGMHGRYFIKCGPANASAAAHDRAAALRLWEESARMTGLAADLVPQLLPHAEAAG
jgi:NAD(P)-dependent dehydrogenase (short-subunit alcohol dehydrogenase family)